MSQDCYEAFAKVVAVANGNPDESMIVCCKDEFMRLGVEFNEGYKQVLHCKQVGVGPWNRDGEGLVLSRAVSRGRAIRMCGFSFTTMQADAVAFEDDPIHTPIAKATIDFTSVDPGCAKYKAHEVKVGPAGATHANHFLAMVHDEVPCDEPSISEHGKVSREKCFKDQNIKKAVLTGVEWYIFRSRLVKLFPDIPKIVQAALNCIASIADGDFKKKHSSAMIIVLAL